MSNNTLPIANFRGEIVTAVNNNWVTIIVAETGAGKSTQVPQYLLEEGYDLVVSQPRVLAARTVAARVAEEMNVELGDLVGYRTSREGKDSKETRCLFCTDGLALVRELMGRNKGVLVLDEVHEWNENMEVLCAWVKQQHAMDNRFKVVLMSATIAAEPLSEYFDGAPIISVPGRLFPVTEEMPQGKLEDDVARLAREGRNVLVFQPGKAEIAETIQVLLDMKVNAEILPLHGGLQPEEQDKCMVEYRRPKIVVSTNVAQTSVTIPDIDAVVDSGMERRKELVDGVEGLYVRPISLADSTQRKGRAGRVKSGVYIDHCGEADRPEFPVAEILRKRLDQTVLRLAIAGFDMEQLSFFHQPDLADIHDARESLIRLGCMTSKGEVTKSGRLVNRLPVSVKFGCMIIEAEKRGVLADVLTVAAIMEVDGIVVPPPSRNRPDNPDWRSMVRGEKVSDVLGQLAVYRMAASMSNSQMREKGISLRSYYRSQEIRKHLERSLQRRFRISTTGNQEDILKSVCAGMVDHVFQRRHGHFLNGDGAARQLGNNSLVRGAQWLVGNPFDLEIKVWDRIREEEVPKTLRLIELATKIEPEWLVEVAPHLVQEGAKTSLRYDQEKGVVVSMIDYSFNGQPLTQIEQPDPEHPMAARAFANWLASVSREYAEAQGASILVKNMDQIEQVRSLNQRAGQVVFPEVTLVGWYLKQLKGARSLNDMVKLKVGVKDLTLLALDAALVQQIEQENPATIELIGRSFPVEYAPLAHPTVRIQYQQTSAKGWLELPDAGVTLPSGQKVAVGVRFGIFAGWITSTDIGLLKRAIAKQVNEALWNEFRASNPVLIDRPAHLSSSTAGIPLEEVQYGTCVLTGKPLVKYGTLSSSRDWDRRLVWNEAWFNIKTDAIETQAASNQELAIEKDRWRGQARREENLEKVEAMKRQLRSLSRHQLWPNGVNLQDRKAVRNLLNDQPVDYGKDLGLWTTSALAVIDRVDAQLNKPAQALSGAALEDRKAALRARFGN